MADCTVYIDEAGDLGINRGTQWFVLSGVVIDKAEEPEIRRQMERIKERLNIREIHLRKIPDFQKRAYVVRELGGVPFTYMNVLVDTQQFDREKIPSPIIAYNYMSKYLLQRVSGFLEETGKSADIVLSSRGTSRDGELIRYIQEKLLPYPNNRIRSERFGKVVAKSAGLWDMLQVADVCATSTFLAYERNGFGFCTPCFSYALSGHLYRGSGKVSGYGIKFFTNEMRPDPEVLRESRICAKKERTPGATAT